jgi:hypothetical protein
LIKKSFNRKSDSAQVIESRMAKLTKNNNNREPAVVPIHYKIDLSGKVYKKDVNGKYIEIHGEEKDEVIKRNRRLLRNNE